MYGHGIVTTVNELLSINLPRDPPTLTRRVERAPRDEGIEKCEKCLRKTTEKGFFSPERFKRVLDLSACFSFPFNSSSRRLVLLFFAERKDFKGK